MIVHQETIVMMTHGRESYNITAKIQDALQQSGLQDGLCNIFLQHTSASIILCENADPTVRQDLERFMRRLVPDGDALFQHSDEGPDDMPAHIRSILTKNDLSIPVHKGKLMLGTWQGIYLWEHRYQEHRRHFNLTFIGK